MVSDNDGIADWYSETVGDKTDDLATAALLKLVGNVSGDRVLDVGCGNGRVARYLARNGLSVTGVDASKKMIGLAVDAERNEPLGITYVHGDVSDISKLIEGVFDGIVANLVLADINDLPTALEATRKGVRERGWLVLSIPHPCFQGSGGFNGPRCHFLTATPEHPAGRLISGYFEEGYWRSYDPSGVRGKVGAYHRTLSTYLNALHEAGWFIERSVEPRPEEQRSASRLHGGSTLSYCSMSRDLRKDGSSVGDWEK